MKYKNGDIYQGTWIEDKKNGMGTLWTSTYSLQGHW